MAETAASSLLCASPNASLICSCLQLVLRKYIASQGEELPEWLKEDAQPAQPPPVSAQGHSPAMPCIR